MTPSSSHSLRRGPRALLRLVCGLVLAGALAVPAAAGADSVRLYEHSDRQGYSFVPGGDDLDPNGDDVDLRWDMLGPCASWLGCKNFNDRASSLHIPPFTCVTLYEHINYGGASIDYCTDQRWPYGWARDANLTGFWNDRASSAKVRPVPSY